MTSCITFLTLKGDVVLQRSYRDDIPNTSIDTFRQTLSSGKLPNSPVINIDGVSFLYTRQNDLYIVIMTRKNANALVGFEFIISIISAFQAFFGVELKEDSLRNNFCLAYEVLDEAMDNGFPQLTTINHLKGAIALGTVKNSGEVSNTRQMDKITSFITGGVDWREAGKHNYKKNEVFMDVLEAVNVLMSSDGTVLRADVSGKIVMKAYLSGMPECKFGLNDKLMMDKDTERRPQVGRRNNTSVAIDDLTFHRCVSLAQFDQDRTVSFVPPDGEFTLMKYRITNQVQLPFTIIPNVVVRGRTRIEYDITIKGAFDPTLAAVNVKVNIPVPVNCASASMKVSQGSAKLKTVQNMVQWKIPRFTGNGVYTLRGEAILAASVEDKVWAKPPITLEFQVPMFTSSGLRVRFLKVVERTQYEAIKWVRYMTRAGNYAVRI